MSRYLTISGIVAAGLLALAWPVASACNFHSLSGFIWSANFGWISLSCQNTGGSIDYGLDINFATSSTAALAGYGWSPNLGWLSFQPATSSWPAAPNNNALFIRNAGESPTSTAGVLTGWAKFIALGDDGWMKLGPLVFDGTDYGVKVATDRTFSGWSFNGGDDLGYPPPGADQGAGWVSWQNQGAGGGGGAQYGGSVVTHWFETLYGDIYSGRPLSAPFSPPAGRYNATYLMQADGSINPVTLRSAGGSGQPWRSENFGAITLPQQSNSYRGTLGNLDRTGILAGYYGTVTTWTGDRTTSATLGTSRLMSGRVWYFTDNLTVNSALTFLRGTGASQDASGTIVVNGNLLINADTVYQSGAVSGRIDNLPSVAWLVRGNITVGPTVRNMAGIFFSEGASGIKTGTTGLSSTDVPLIVSGMLIGKKITLERLYKDQANTPSEQIIFDGRAVVNPPPGLVDLMKWLPIWQEVTP